ncbi:prenyltransferase [Serinicoccus kebangsaanensis]|uniref:prenyltransferase n=1 Tax=Serinicoccus kebangsaanensis TaxID=2602069 RepID=UPI00178C3B56|nr:prenyltransferase [Serinicoccus kebangsaanensis]
MTGTGRGPGRAGRVRTAARLSRPDHVLLILVVYAVGCAAGARGAPAGGAALPTAGVVLTGVAVAVVAVGVHAVNEFADTETDARTTRTRFSGGSGALAASGLPRAFALRVALVAAAVAGSLTLLGLVVGWITGTVAMLLALGLVGGWAYSVGPWPFSRHGWGEVVNALLGGLLLPITGAVAVGAPPAWAALTFVPFALLTFVNLLETQWADREADRSASKHTLASRLSPSALRRAGGVAAVLAYGLSLVVHPWSVAVAGLLAAPLSAYGVRRLGQGPPGPSVVAMVLFLLLQGAAWSLR